VTVALLVDDLLVKPFVGLLDVIHAMAVEEQYDEDAITDDLKENQLLYELGERSEETYRERKRELEAELQAAREAKAQLRNRVEIKQ